MHTHSYYSPDSSTPLWKNVEQAIEMGLKYFAATDHMDRFTEEYAEKDSYFDVESYFKELRELQDKYGDQINLLIGVEVGLQPDVCEWMDEFMMEYPFDFVIGSIHFVNHVDIAFCQEELARNTDKWYRDYYEQMLYSVQHSKNFQFLGHIDYIDRYLKDKSLIPDYKCHAEIIDEILKELIRTDRGIEVNTAGKRKGLSYFNPKNKILKRYRELGGSLITISSDAHFIEDIGYGTSEAIELLKELGFEALSVYRNRELIEIPLTK